jgi:hypothetical protein
VTVVVANTVFPIVGALILAVGGFGGFVALMIREEERER